eukprot:gnl/Dysnectes_brevis/3554_a4516_530.p1 GENE.gnl/Dysnectes_brevis/3554_a4516_530~~gnl/Dysnectes_brevis/3554_a4516_530.p1  ORF type:complete len:474 (+),score=104.35 gnl/Dysnectes_brevis/3554_a4516_530:31-1452(+)
MMSSNPSEDLFDLDRSTMQDTQKLLELSSRLRTAASRKAQDRKETSRRLDKTMKRLDKTKETVYRLKESERRSQVRIRSKEERERVLKTTIDDLKVQNRELKYKLKHSRDTLPIDSRQLQNENEVLHDTCAQLIKLMSSSKAPESKRITRIVKNSGMGAIFMKPTLRSSGVSHSQRMTSGHTMRHSSSGGSSAHKLRAGPGLEGDWIPTECFDIMSRFSTAHKVDTDSSRGLLLALSACFKQSEQQAVRAEQKAHKKKVQELRRRLDGRQPYREVMLESEVQRLQRQVAELKKKRPRPVSAAHTSSRGGKRGSSTGKRRVNVTLRRRADPPPAWLERLRTDLARLRSSLGSVGMEVPPGDSPSFFPFLSGATESSKLFLGIVHQLSNTVGEHHARLLRRMADIELSATRADMGRTLIRAAEDSVADVEGAMGSALSSCRRSLERFLLVGDEDDVSGDEGISDVTDDSLSFSDL